MFVVVRNIKSNNGTQPQPSVEEPKYKNEYRINRGDTIKMGRLKFTVKDFRSESHPAALDTGSHSPIKQ